MFMIRTIQNVVDIHAFDVELWSSRLPPQSAFCLFFYFKGKKNFFEKINFQNYHFSQFSVFWKVVSWRDTTFSRILNFFRAHDDDDVCLPRLVGNYKFCRVYSGRRLLQASVSRCIVCKIQVYFKLATIRYFNWVNIISCEVATNRYFFNGPTKASFSVFSNIKQISFTTY